MVLPDSGIFPAHDVIDDARNGATLFQIGSALVSEEIKVFSRLKAELKENLQDNGYTNVEEVVGEAHKR